MYRRSRALAHLPGPKPKNWFMGYMEMAYSQQPHRLNTALSETFGPIWKFRILCFHVSPLCLVQFQPWFLPSGELGVEQSCQKSATLACSCSALLSAWYS